MIQFEAHYQGRCFLIWIPLVSIGLPAGGPCPLQLQASEGIPLEQIAAPGPLGLLLPSYSRKCALERCDLIDCDFGQTPDVARLN